MVRELDPFSWITFSVLELNLDLLPVLTMELVFITVATMRMLEFSAETVSGECTNF